MNEYMVMQHNRVVGQEDRVYFLGDVCMPKTAAALTILSRMNGKKVLIKGNHDMAKMSQYQMYFDDIRSVHTLDGMILSHIPVHPESLSRWKVNVHGHLHHRAVRFENTNIPDPRYVSVCMERLNDYTPISLEELKKKI